MKRLRDNQRSKVYAAEQVLEKFGNVRFESLDEVRKEIERIASHKWFRKRYPGFYIQSLRPGKGARFARGGKSIFGGARFTFPRWSRKQWVILHEIAHAVGDSRWIAPHGREFCRTYLALVGHYLGKEAAAALKTSFKDHRVKYRRRRVQRRNVIPFRRVQAM